MKLDIHIDAQLPHSEPAARKNLAESVEVTRDGSRLRVVLDGRVIEADAVEVAAGTYSILLAGRAFEVRVEPAANGLRVHTGPREFSVKIADPRAWQRSRGGALASEGRQEVVAPMPGKVVRVLVKQGEAVEAGHGLFVMEAMKMQNEIRSPKKGILERVLVTEGRTVNAGETLAVVV